MFLRFVQVSLYCSQHDVILPVCLIKIYSIYISSKYLGMKRRFQKQVSTHILYVPSRKLPEEDNVNVTPRNLPIFHRNARLKQIFNAEQRIIHMAGECFNSSSLSCQYIHERNLTSLFQGKPLLLS